MGLDPSLPAVLESCPAQLNWCHTPHQGSSNCIQVHKILQLCETAHNSPTEILLIFMRDLHLFLKL